MIRSRPFVRVCIALLSITILVMRLGGAHLHLCMDGSEAPVSVHLTADSGANDASIGVGEAHHDQDVSLSGEVLAKKLDAAAQLPALFAGLLVLFFVPLLLVSVVPRDRTALIHRIPIFRIRPPLRAPPV